MQRELRPQWAEHIRDEFDPDAFGFLYVIRRGERFLVFDGAHRLWAAGEYLGKDQMVPCRIFEDIPDSELAALTQRLNHSKAWRAMDLFVQRIIAGEAKAKGILATLHRYDLDVGLRQGVGIVSAVGACDWIIDRIGGQAVFDQTIATAHGAYAHNADAYDGRFLRGLAHVYYSQDGRCSQAEMTRKLAKTGGPSRLIGNARDLAASARISVHRAMAEVLIGVYNRGRRTEKLTTMFL